MVCIEAVITDFGEVVLSPKVIAYLDQVAPRRHSTKRHRGKAYEREKSKFQDVLRAVMTCAEIQYRSGEPEMLEVF